MNIDQLDALIFGSVRDDWTHLHMPLFHSRGIEGRSGLERLESHDARAVLRSNVDVAVEWGMARPTSDRNEVHVWAQKVGFADPALHTFHADIFYHGSLVDRF